MKYAQKIKNVTLILVGLTSFSFVNINLSYAFDFIALPGAPEFSEELKLEIQNEWELRPSSYVARTRHLNEDGTPLYANRLIVEPSPYLRQHAHNPVNWYPWGEDAFRSAQDLDRPILLSIGYSACHWCHVMEEESYDHELIAQFLNENFISIKVDRESRPEIDELYLLAVQIMGGSGGWPLNVLLTSDGRPFWGTTYLPPDELATVLRAMKDAWTDQSQRSEITNVAQQVHAIIDGFGQGEKTDIEVGRKQVETVVSELVELEKSKDAFTLPTASFPSESELFLLLDEALRQPDSEALYAAESRLLAMAKGGIRDHVGGGFHRYTVDSEWLVPHFEKMLYNQALLGRAYLYAFEITAKDIYRRVAEELFTYVLRDMRNDDGLFFSATDADSEGEEGVFFLWTPEEIDAATDNAEFVLRHFGVTDNGNFEGRNILFLEKTPEQVALEVGTRLEDYLIQLEQAREQLRLYRDQREKPFLDEKVIAAWNGLMITSLAEASRILEKKEYLNAAITAAESFWGRFVRDNGEIYRVLFIDQLSQAGKLKDYAFMSQGFLSLYDETADRIWLSRSESLTEKMMELFWDDERWGFYSVAENDMDGLISRQKDRFDEALPAGNSVAMKVLSMLYYRTGKRIYSQRVDQTVQAFASEIYSYPSSFSYALSAISEHRGGPVGVREYAASGHVRVKVSTPRESVGHLKAVVEIQLDEGWHIQSNKPLSENLIATRIDIESNEWRLAGIEFPEEEFITTKFQSEPLSVWSGNVVVPIEFDDHGEKKVNPVLNVRLQACDDQSCLLPETVQLEIPINSITS